MAMAHTSIFRAIPSSGGTAQPPYARVPTTSASSLVSYDAPLKTPEPPIKKKRQRLNAHQFRTLSTVLSQTRYPSTEKREQLARYLGIQTRSVQVWWVPLFTPCIISELSILFSQVPEPEAELEAPRRTKSREPSNRPGHSNSHSRHHA
jgi:hypothetical protein